MVVISRPESKQQQQQQQLRQRKRRLMRHLSLGCLSIEHVLVCFGHCLQVRTIIRCIPLALPSRCPRTSGERREPQEPPTNFELIRERTTPMTTQQLLRQALETKTSLAKEIFIATLVVGILSHQTFLENTSHPKHTRRQWRRESGKKKRREGRKKELRNIGQRGQGWENNKMSSWHQQTTMD